MMGCDTLLTVGSNFPYTQFLPPLDQARAVQIDRSEAWIGMRYPYELNLVGDARTTLQALIPLLHRKEDRCWREEVEGDVADWWQTVDTWAAERRRTRSTRCGSSRELSSRAAEQRHGRRRLRQRRQLVRPRT